MSFPVARLLVALSLCACRGSGYEDAPSVTPAPSPEPDPPTPAHDAGPSAAIDSRPDVATREVSGQEVNGQVDATPIAAAVGCQVARFCDDFEAYTAGKAPAGGWRATTGGGATLAVDTARAWSGTKSVHITTTTAAGGASRATIHRGAPLLPLPDNDVHGRMMVWLAASPGNAHWGGVLASGRTPAGVGAFYEIGGMNGRFLSNYNPHDCGHLSKTPFPVGRWSCLQWQFDGSKNPDGTTKNELRLWADGIPVNDVTVLRFSGPCAGDGTRAEWIAPTFDTITLGMEVYMTAPPAEMWIDDVAVDSRPIACPTKP